MREVFDDMREHTKRRKKRNLETADDTGWTKHTQWHWSRMLDNAKIDYWPSKNKWRYKRKTYHGNINTWLAKRDPTYVLLVTTLSKTNEQIWNDMGYKKVDPKKFVVDFTKENIEIVNTDYKEVELRATINYNGKKPPWED